MAQENIPANNTAVPLDRVVKFVRQFSHDARNHLGSMDLQSAYLAELSTDPELTAELKKLRAMISGAARSIQAMTAQLSVSKPNPLALKASMFFEDFQQRLAHMLPDQAPSIQWEVDTGEVTVEFDMEMMFNALCELCRNALQFQDPAHPLEASVRAAADTLVFELRARPRSIDLPLEQWGMEPFVTTRRGGYGLGLFHARQLLALNGGDLQFLQDTAKEGTITRVTLRHAPLADNG